MELIYSPLQRAVAHVPACGCVHYFLAHTSENDWFQEQTLIGSEMILDESNRLVVA
jgi:hypothetical protein